MANKQLKSVRFTDEHGVLSNDIYYVPQNADEFSTSVAYAVGDYVSNAGKLYKFKAAHAAGAWNSAEVDEVTVGDELALQSSRIDELTNETKTVTGNPIKITDGVEGMPVKDMQISFAPKQAGTGDPSPDNVRAITGWDGIIVTDCGKNLINPNNYLQRDGYSNISVSTNGDNIVVSGYNGNGRFVAFFITTEIGQKYTIKCANATGTSGEIYYYTADDRLYISPNYNGNHFNISNKQTVTSDKKYLYVTFELTDNAVISKLQIVKGEDASDATFTSYADSVVYNFQTTQYGGTIDVLRGKAIVNKVAKIFDGSESWTYQSDSLYFTYYLGAKGSGVDHAVICNYFPQTSITSMNRNQGIDVVNSNAFNALTCYLRYDALGVTTSEDLATWFSTHNTTIVYELSTPIEIDLTPAEISLLAGYNYIYSDSNGNITMEYGEAIAALDEKIDREISKLPATVAPLMDSTAAIGSSSKFAKEDHVHPSDTSKVPTTRMVNSKMLSDDIILNAGDIGYSGSASYSSDTIGNELQSQDGRLDGIEDVVDFITNGDTNNVTGNPIEITDGIEGMPAKELSVAFNPKQNLNGYSYAWPAGGGKNLFIADAKTTTTYLTYTLEADGTLTINGTSTGNADFSIPLTKSISVVQGDVIHVKFFVISGTISSNGRILLNNYQEADYVTPGNDFTATITVNESAPTISSIVIRYFTGASFDNVKVKITIDKQSTALSAYEPYENICPITGWDSVDFIRCGKNLFDKSTIRFDHYYNAYGTYSSSTSYCVSDFIPVLPNTQYYVNDSLPVIHAFNKSKTWVQRVRDAVSAATFTTPSNCYYICIQNYSQKGSREAQQAAANAAMLNVGSSGVTYTPFAGNDLFSSSFSTTQYGGTIDVLRGKAYVDMTRIRVAATLGDGWQLESGKPHSFFVYSGAIPGYFAGNTVENDSRFVCDTFKTQTPATVYAGTTNCIGKESARLRLAVTSCSTVSDLQTFLTNNEVYLCYKLATPVEIGLTPAELSLLAGYNYLYSNSNGNITMEYGEAIASLDEKIDREIAHLDCIKRVIAIDNGTTSVDSVSCTFPSNGLFLVVAFMWDSATNVDDKLGVYMCISDPGNWESLHVIKSSGVFTPSVPATKNGIEIAISPSKKWVNLEVYDMLNLA